MTQDKPFSFRNFLAPMIIIGVLCALCYARTVSFPYVYDDKSVISGVSAFHQPLKWEDFLSRRYFDVFAERTYRPVATISFFADSLLWNLNSSGAHVVSIVLHFLISLLIFGILRIIIGGRAAPLIGAAVFAVHPTHVEAVALASNREELLGALFFFCTLYMFVLWRFRRRNYASYLSLAAAAFFLAVFSKEMAASLPLILVVCDLAFFKDQGSTCKRLKRAIPFYVATSASVIFFLALRYSLLRNEVGEVSWPGGNPAATLLTMSKVFFLYVKLLFVPFPLCADHVIGVSRGLFGIGGFSLAALILITVLAVVFLRRFPIPCFSFLFLLISWLPASNIIPFGELMAERYIYIPSFAISLFASWVFSTAKVPFSVKVASASLITAVFACLTLVQSGVWQSDFVLWRSTAKCAPLSSTAHQNLGNSYALQGKPKLALLEYDRAAACPFVDEPHKLAYNRGLALLSMGKELEAADSFLKSIRIDPEFSEPHFSLGSLAERNGNSTLAEFHYMRAVQKSPQNPLANYIAGRHILQHAESESDYRRSFRLLNRSVAQNPLDANAHAALGAAMLKLGNTRAAAIELNSALRLDPGNRPALMLIRRYGIPSLPEASFSSVSNLNELRLSRMLLCLVVLVAVAVIFYVHYISTE